MSIDELAMPFAANPAPKPAGGVTVIDDAPTVIAAPVGNTVFGVAVPLTWMSIAMGGTAPPNDSEPHVTLTFSVPDVAPAGAAAVPTYRAPSAAEANTVALSAPKARRNR